MYLMEKKKNLLQALYDYSRVPLWIYDREFRLKGCFADGLPQKIRNALSVHMNRLIAESNGPDFDILSYENELYYVFTFRDEKEKYFLLGGPMLLSGFFHVTEMRALSFADLLDPNGLKLLAENLPVVSPASFGACLRLTMLIFDRVAPSLEEIGNYRASSLQGTVERTVTRELFQNMESFRLHTPYSEEVAVLNCVRDGDQVQLEATYRTLPQTKYGNMSSNPLRLFFYGCIANTTLVTRYAIEGGLDEETAFTLSDVYIKRMENCKTYYELNLLNEKMALDFTQRVAESKKSVRGAYAKPVAKCIACILKNLPNKITVNDLAEEVHLTPKYLSHLFRKETGGTISSFIKEQRVEKAKKLLMYSQYSYNEISDSLAFYSQSYFISVFKKYAGMTPKEYRIRFQK